MTRSMRSPTRWAAVFVALLLAAALLPAATAEAAACDTQKNYSYQRLLECLTADGIAEHLQAFQDVADANDNPFYPGTRVAGTDGYDASVDYIVEQLLGAGWDVTLDPVRAVFTFPAEMRILTPSQEIELDTGAFTGSGAGEVEGTVVPVDLALENRDDSTSGCEPEDFDGIDLSGDSDVVLVQRGACFFSVKATNAQAAGAEAVVIFNQGNTDDRLDLIVANASDLPDGSPSNLQIPVVGASFADGERLAQDGTRVYVKTLPNDDIVSYNVLAEFDGLNTDNVVMAGAHLDSVEEGPGIQDNGTGSAALLELALLLQRNTPENTLRFAWWAAEEQGLVGSTAYVQELSEAERDEIAAYLNFDMIGSPNAIYGLYDADESSFEAAVEVPDGSAALEDLFELYFTWQQVPYEDSAFSGRSDYAEFIAVDIPSAGLFTGAEVPKTEEQAEIWGGVAGAPFDPCYHLACDTLTDDVERDEAVYDVLRDEYRLLGNVNMDALDRNADAIAFAVLSLSYSTQDVNGVKGRRVPGSQDLDLPTEPAGPEGTWLGDDAGGLDPHAGDHPPA